MGFGNENEQSSLDVCALSFIDSESLGWAGLSWAGLGSVAAGFSPMYANSVLGCSCCEGKEEEKGIEKWQEKQEG